MTSFTPNIERHPTCTPPWAVGALEWFGDGVEFGTDMLSKRGSYGPSHGLETTSRSLFGQESGKNSALARKGEKV